MNIWNAAKLLTLATLSAVNMAHAGSANQHFSRGAGHSTKAVGHSATASGKAMLSVAALPFAVVGSVGQLSSHASEEMWDLANRPIGTSLPISDVTLTVGPPPEEALTEKGAVK